MPQVEKSGDARSHERPDEVEWCVVNLVASVFVDEKPGHCSHGEGYDRVVASAEFGAGLNHRKEGGRDTKGA